MRAKKHHPGRLARPTLAALVALAASLGGGCAAVTNPTAFEAVPVHRVAPEVLGKPREELKDVPFTKLKQNANDIYRLDANDVLSVFLPGVLGQVGQPPPVTLPQNSTIFGAPLPPAIGYPVPVQSDGTISLTILPDTVDVRGLTVLEAQTRIRDAYAKSGVVANANQAIVTLLQRRTYHITVIRQDSGSLQLGGNGALSNSRRGTGIVLDLPPGENDVLTAITRSGGLPGNDANNSVIIQRNVANTVLEGPNTDPLAGTKVTRIPLRIRQGESLPFTHDDIILKDGDVVFVESRQTELFYTGGLLPPGEFPIPRDYDLDVLEAVSQQHGPLYNGAINYNNLAGNTLQAGLGFPSPSLLTVIRKTPGGRQIAIRVDLNRAVQDPRERILVQPGDFLVLQETVGESITRYITQRVTLNLFGTIIRQRDLTGTTNITLP